MRILFLSLSNTYETLIEQLESEGHTAEQITEQEGIILPSDSIFLVEEKLLTFSPDYIINNIPSLSLPDFSNCTVIANTEASANLELKKWETRQKAGELGFSLPEVIEECTLNTVSTTHTNTIFLKPKGIDPHHQSWKIPAGTDIWRHNKQFPSNFPAYVEADTEHDMQVDCLFTIHNGSYAIYNITASTSKGDEKILFNGGLTNWNIGLESITLTAEQNTLVTALFNTWLTYVVTLGGSYQGCITTGLKGENLYWYEQNSRKETHTSFIGSGQDWLNSLTVDSSECSKTQWTYNL